jgi:hypothetical protein
MMKLCNILQHMTTLGKKRISRLVLNNSFRNICFKIPKEFSTVLLLQDNCWLNNASRIVWQMPTCLWGTINQGKRDTPYCQECTA